MNESRKKIIFKHKIEPKEFCKFLLTLNKKTLYNFTKFGNVTKNNVDVVASNELNDKNKIKFFGFVENELISYSFLSKFEKSTKKHNCILGIVIGEKFQNMGFGKKLCSNMISHAWKSKFKKIWLTVYLDNLPAIKLYYSLGFELEGIFMDAEYYNKKPRHTLSLALFKSSSFTYNQKNDLFQTFLKKSNLIPKNIMKSDAGK